MIGYKMHLKHHFSLLHFFVTNGNRLLLPVSTP